MVNDTPPLFIITFNQQTFNAFILVKVVNNVSVQDRLATWPIAGSNINKAGILKIKLKTQILDYVNKY